MYEYNDVSGVITAILVIFIVFNLVILFLIIAILRAILNTSKQTERTAYTAQMILQQIAPQPAFVPTSMQTNPIAAEHVGQDQPSQEAVDVLNVIRRAPGTRNEVWQQCQQIPNSTFDRVLVDLLSRKWIVQHPDDTYHAIV